MKHERITQAIIEAFYVVYNTLGYGFLEKVYEESLVCEIVHRGLVVQQQAPIEVFYREKKVGEYFADMLVNDLVIVEIKAVETLGEKHEAQLLNYLRSTNMEVGLLLNFGPKPQIKRKIFEVRYKELDTELRYTVRRMNMDQTRSG